MLTKAPPLPTTEASPLTTQQQYVLAALYAYDKVGQKSFRKEKGISNGQWKRAVVALYERGLVDACGVLSTEAEERVRLHNDKHYFGPALPQLVSPEIWSDI